MILAIYLVCVFFILLWAHENQKSVFGYGLLALVFSPLIAAIFLFFSSEPRRCPECAEKIKPEAIKCKHCGSYVTKKAV